MTQKAIITKQQAEAIEAALQLHSNDFILESSMMPDGGWIGLKPFEALNAMDFKLLAKALYAGYEVKEEYHPGDLVFAHETEKIYKLIARWKEKDGTKYGDAWNLEDRTSWLGEKQFRAATEPEILWLHELGRRYVGDVGHGDVLIYKNGDYRLIKELSDFDFGHADLEDGLIAGIYPGEYYKALEKGKTK